MFAFLIYTAKVAVALLVFYLFYRFLLKKETFHRFNRFVLVGTAAMSFLLPLCIVTIRKPLEPVVAGPVEPVGAGAELAAEAEAVAESAAATPWWPVALTVLFLAGAAFVLLRVAVSILCIARIVRQGECVREEDGCRIIVTERNIDPFSWMRYIVLSREDWEGPHAPILAHEKAHIAYGHSVELLLVDVLSMFQWFNPAIWMLRADLQELHEFEADDAVLRGGANLKEYQYLLIRKAVSRSGYSVANSFNHSILKNRITMMSKSKSSLARGLRVLYLLPLICLGLGLQARTVYVPTDKGSENFQNPLIILREAWGEEKEITKAEYDALSQSRINSIEMLKDDAAFKKYGDKAAHGVIVVTLKAPMEMEEIVVVRYREVEEEPIAFRLIPDQMPRFQGGDLNEFSKWLCQRIYTPEDCNHSGTMRVSFEVLADGTVGDVQVLESVCPELDAIVTATIRKSPKWEPGTTRDGKPIATNLKIPIIFQVRNTAKK
ncbi:MAG: TonB family protein [Bacteroidales bacterium]|nr:TonB family protein [Bacteroidales bacterium]